MWLQLLSITCVLHLVQALPASSSNNLTTLLNGGNLGVPPDIFDIALGEELGKIATIWPRFQSWSLDIRSDNGFPGLVLDESTIVVYTAVEHVSGLGRSYTFTSANQPPNTIHFDIIQPETAPIDLRREIHWVWYIQEIVPLIEAYRAVAALGVYGWITHIKIAKWNRDPYLPPAQPMQLYYVFTNTGPNGDITERFWYGCQDKIVRRQLALGAIDDWPKGVANVTSGSTSSVSDY